MKMTRILSLVGATTVALAVSLVAVYAGTPEPAAATGTWYYARIAEYGHGDQDAPLVAPAKLYIMNNDGEAAPHPWPSSGCGTTVNGFGTRALHWGMQKATPGLPPSGSTDALISFAGTSPFMSAVGVLIVPATATETRVCCLNDAKTTAVTCDSSAAWSVYYGSADLL